MTYFRLVNYKNFCHRCFWQKLSLILNKNTVESKNISLTFDTMLLTISN